MKHLESITKWGLGAIVSVCSYLFGGLDMMLQTLLFLIGLDIFTGWIAGAYQGKLSSKVSFKGILKKIVIISMVVLGYRLDMLGMEKIVQGVVGLDIENPARTMIVLWFLGGEGLSITENVGKVIELPKWITKFFEVLKQKGDGGN